MNETFNETGPNNGNTILRMTLTADMTFVLSHVSCQS